MLTFTDLIVTSSIVATMCWPCDAWLRALLLLTAYYYMIDLSEDCMAIMDHFSLSMHLVGTIGERLSVLL